MNLISSELTNKFIRFMLFENTGVVFMIHCLYDPVIPN